MSVEATSAARRRRASDASFRRTAARLAAFGGVGALVVIFATPAFGLRRQLVRLASGGNDPVHVAARSNQATQVLSLPLHALPNKKLVFWTAPSPTGGRCEFAQIVDASVTPSRADANAAGVCRSSVQPASLPIGPTLSWTRIDAANVDLLIRGSVAPGSQITRIELQWNGGATELPVRGGYFVGELPQTSPDMGTLPTTGGPYRLVGYSANGDAVATLDLQEFLALTRPH